MIRETLDRANTVPAPPAGAVASLPPRCPPPDHAGGE